MGRGRPRRRGAGDLVKRRADVPDIGLGLRDHVSKADLLEAAWELASLCNDAGSVDDDASTLAKLLETLNGARERSGRGPVKAARCLA